VSEFELLVIPLSVVLGVGVTRILGGIIHAIRHRDEASAHWVPVAWGVLIFVYNVGYFNVLWEINQRGPSWTWPLFGMQLITAVLLFLSAGLILSSDESATSLGMLGNFEKHGRLALIPLGLFLALAIPFNKWTGGPDWISPQNALNVALAALIAFVFFVQRVSWRGIGTIAFAAVSAVGWFVFWARPGDG
jgi:hypothetical protein